jgi:signal transduction histidine kinase
LRREIAELRASRTRLASASDAERRAFERALHEGVQQDLVGLVANLEVVAGSLGSDPAAVRTMLNELQREALRALTEVQELATRIFPPLLAAGGLVADLRAAAARAKVPMGVEVAVTSPVPPETAGAVYFCALDVFERVPDGTPVAVSVRSVDGTLAFEFVAQCGLGTERLAPHDRIEALGGRVTITSGARTTVAGSVPLPP